MNLVDRIVKMIAEKPFPRPWWGGDDFRGYAKAIAEVVRPRIETQAELDALPIGSVVSIGRGCGLYEKDQAGDWGWPDNDYPFREAEHSGEDVILLYTPEDNE